MSGEGVISMEQQMRFAAERAGAIADVLAYLSRRQANCQVMAQAQAEFASAARERARQLGVLIDEIGAGFHEGAAAVEAQLAGEMSADAAIVAEDTETPMGEQ